MLLQHLVFLWGDFTNLLLLGVRLFPVHRFRFCLEPMFQHCWENLELRCAHGVPKGLLIPLGSIPRWKQLYLLMLLLPIVFAFLSLCFLRFFRCLSPRHQDIGIGLFLWCSYENSVFNVNNQLKKVIRQSDATKKAWKYRMVDEKTWWISKSIKQVWGF